jgi:hypothetical protein
MDEIEDRYLDKTKQYNDPLRMWVEELDRINTDLSTVLINAVEDFGRAQKRIDELESDLKLNTSMLAKQTDLAREAGTFLVELKETMEKYRSSIWEDHHEVDRTLYKVLDELK